MCAVMCAPATYTGEHVVELSCHGGMVVVSRMLDVLFSAGARPAEAGEFTKRAFLNGKVDLIQAEAVADLIHAQSELQRKVAQRQLAGSLSGQIDAMADEMVQLLGLIEANIDFIEEDIDALDRDAAVETVDRQLRRLDALLEGATLSKPFRHGFHVAIAGPVNAGKSSLFNRLVGEQRAIVTEIPGTTRDLLREPVVIDGLLFLFHDTAGLRDVAADQVESIGIDLANDAVRSADAVVFVVDGTLEPDTATLDAIRGLDPGRAIAAVNKSDLWPEGTAAPATAELEALDTGLECVTLSAVRGDGLEELRRALMTKVGGEALATMARERVVLNARLVGLLDDARGKNRVLRESLLAHKPLEIMAVEAREALSPFEQATGRTYQDDVLDVIFSRFCIGK
jgi:tRNA modification GTPase